MELSLRIEQQSWNALTKGSALSKVSELSNKVEILYLKAQHWVKSQIWDSVNLKSWIGQVNFIIFLVLGALCFEDETLLEGWGKCNEVALPIF